MCPWCGGQSGTGLMGSGNMMGGAFGLGWILSLVFYVLIIAGIVLLIWWLVRQSTGTASTPKGKKALEILDERYAKGDISEKEYNKIKKDINS